MSVRTPCTSPVGTKSVYIALREGSTLDILSPREVSFNCLEAPQTLFIQSFVHLIVSIDHLYLPAFFRLLWRLLRLVAVAIVVATSGCCCIRWPLSGEVLLVCWSLGCRIRGKGYTRSAISGCCCVWWLLPHPAAAASGCICLRA